MPTATPEAPASNKVINITATAPGTKETIESTAGGKIQFGYDPANASFERVDNSLVITANDGGSVVLENYFVVGDQPLPDFVLPDGTVVAGADFLQAQAGNMDLSTAAGRTAAAPGSGGTNYDDDAGSLLGGVDKLGSQGTDYWDRGTRTTETDLGLEVPGATIGLTVVVNIPTNPEENADGRITGTYTNALFEDSQPNQHLDGKEAAREPGILQIGITTTGTTAVTGLDLNGFSAGTRIEIQGGRTIIIEGPGQVVTLTPAEIAGTILLYAPENNSDADMTIGYTLRYATVYGVTGETSGTFALAVDAVADKPFDVGSEGTSGDFAHQNGTENEYSKEVATDGTQKITTGEQDSITLHVKASFGDTQDGSETHTIEVRGVPAGWVLDETQGLAQNYSSTVVESTDGTRTYIFTIIDGDTTEGVTLDSSVVFKPGDWTSDRLNSGEENDHKPTNISIVAVAEEKALSGAEATTVNNRAETECGKYEITVVEDTPDFREASDNTVTLTADESKEVQPGTDEVPELRPELQTKLAALGAPATTPVSIAEKVINYNLHSDGTDDNGGDRGQASLAFEKPEFGDYPVPTQWLTTGGEKIYLHYEDGTVIGKTTAGDTAFIVMVEGTLQGGGAEAGKVTFIEYMSLQHPDGGNLHDELLRNDLKLTLTLRDDDGDKTSLDVVLNVHDDGPSDLVIGNAHKLDETFMYDTNHDGALNTFNTTCGKVTVDFGADGPAAVPYTLDVTALKAMNLTSGGKAITIDDTDPTSIVGKVGDVTIFTLRIDASGNYEYKQLQPLDHLDDHDDTLELEFSIVATDGDGDTTSAGTIIRVDDDGPKLLCNDIRVTLSETDLSGGSDAQHMFNNASGNLHDESQFVGFIGFSYGTDGPASATNAAGSNPFAWNVSELEKYQTYDANGKPVDVKWELSNDCLTLTGFASGGSIDNPAIVIKATLTPGGATYTVDQSAPLFHDQPSHDNTLELKIGFTITDGDGDTSTGNMTVTIKDDVPCAGLCDVNDIVFEKDLRDGGVITTSGELTVSFGADGAHAETPIFWDEKSITQELGNYNVIINGEHVTITSDMVTLSENGKTFTVTVDGKPVLSATLSYDTVTGKCSYTYTQSEPLEHGASGTPADLGRKLDLKYTIMDGDGDVSSNELDVYVTDSVALPGGGSGHFDETAARSGFPIHGSIALALDYNTPDGIQDVNWNKALIDKALATYNDAAPKEADGFACTVSEDGSTLTITQFGKAVLEMKLVANPDGTYSATYNQFAQMDHPLGAQVLGLSHDEPIPFLLPINIIDGDGDTTLGLVTVTVDDDGPNPAVGSNVGLLAGLGSDLLHSLDDLDFSNADAFLASLTKALGDSVTASIGDTSALLDLADMALNTDLARFDSTMLDFVVKAVGGSLDLQSILAMQNIGETLNTLIKGVPDFAGIDYTSMNPAQLLTEVPRLIAYLGKIPVELASGDGSPTLEAILGKDTDRTEKAGQVYTVQLQDLDFGADGPAAENAVTWNKEGVTSLLKVIGLHATGHGGEALTVEGSGQHLLVKSGGIDLLKLDIDDTGKATITQLAPLGHNPGSLEDLLSGLGGQLAGDNELLNTLKALGLEPSDILAGLSGGNILALPLPVVITDHDGDSAPGMISVVIRDSEPVKPGEVHAYVGESDLLDGRDADKAAENVLNNTSDDETAYQGQFKVDFGFDGAHKDTPFQWNLPDVGQIKTADGQDVTWKYDANNPKVIVGYDDDNNEVIRVTADLKADGTVDYSVAVKEALQHPAPVEGGNDENNLDLPVSFTIRDADNDTQPGKLTISIKDDIVETNDEKGAVEAGTDTATGNILDNDNYGADGRRDADGLKVEGKDWSSAEDVNEHGEITISGKYGDLFIKADGSYRYVADPDRLAKTLSEYPKDTNTVDTADTNISVLNAGGKTFDSPVHSLTLEFKDLFCKDFTQTQNILGAKASATYTLTEKVTITCILENGDTKVVDVVGDADGNVTWTAPAAWGNIASYNVSYVAPTIDLTASSSSGIGGAAALAAMKAAAYAEAVAQGASSTLDSVTTTVRQEAPPETFTYTLTDKDGDSKEATLTITDVRAPILVGISGATEVFESGTDSQATYTIKAYDYNGNAAAGNLLFEDITVTVKISPAMLENQKDASLDDLDFAKIQELNPNVTSYDPTNGTITLTIPKGSGGEITLTLPMKEDSLGGKGTASDGPTEQYTVAIDSVSSESGKVLDPTEAAQKARYGELEDKISTKQDTTLVDDGTKWNPDLNDGKGGYEYANNEVGQYLTNDEAMEHPLDGPVVSVTTSANSINEGGSCTVTVNLNQFTGTGTGKGATWNSNLVEDLTITLNINTGDVTSAGSTNPINLTLSNDLTSLMSTGKITGYSFNNASGEMKLTLKAGMTPAELAKIKFTLSVPNDQAVEDTQHFSVKVTGATGNESLYDGSAKGVAVNDTIDTISLNLKGGGTVTEGENLVYTLQLLNSSKNLVGSSNIDGSIDITLSFTPTATLGATAGNDYLPVLKNYADGQNPDAYAALKSALGLPAGASITNVDITEKGGFQLELHVEKGAWGNGEFKITIPTQTDNFVGEPVEGFTVKIEDYSKELGNQEVKGIVSDSANGVIQETAGLRIAGDATVYEDTSSSHTIATYNIKVQDKQDVIDAASGKVAGQSFSFDVTLQDKGATFDSNIQNNYVTAEGDNKLLHNSNVGDYGWAINGAIIQYGDLTIGEAGINDLKNAINTYLEAHSEYNGIRVTGVTNGGRSLTFAVEKGVSIDALEKLPIQVAAIDDAATDPNESYALRLGNIQELDETKDGYDSLGTNKKYITNPGLKQDTNIVDDADKVTRDGYYVGLKDTTVNESNSELNVSVAFFQHKANGEIIDADPNNPPASQGFSLKFGVANDTAELNKDFVEDGNSLNIPAHTQGDSRWTFVEATEGTPAHWEFKADLSELYVVKDDRETEGDQTFNLQLKGVSGHESVSLLETQYKTVGDVGNIAKVTIIDDNKLQEGPHKLDGPEVVFFGPMERVIEPVAPGVTSGNTNAPTHAVTYKVGLSQAAAQNMVVFLNIANVANVGQDFTLGENETFGKLDDATLKQLEKDYPQYAPLNPNGANYFLIIKEGESSGEIPVKILHDHDTASVIGGTDDSITGSRNSEHVHMQITNMQGSEARYDSTNPNNTTHEAIEDDMRGPVVSFDVTGNRVEWSGQDEPTIKLNLPVSCDEDVTVRMELLDANGNLLTGTDGKNLYLTYTFENGTADIANLNIADLLKQQYPDNKFVLGDDFFIRIHDVQGGEAQANTGIIYMDHDYGGNIPEIEGFTATSIHEGQNDTIEYTLTLKMPSKNWNKDITFTLKYVNGTTDGDDFQNTNESADVTIWKNALKDLDTNGEYKLTINQEGVYLGDKKIGVVEGNLPSAVDDTLVEGDEHFITIITNAKGVDVDAAVADSTIVDNDKATVKVEFGKLVNGEWETLTQAPEGGEVYVRVRLVDSNDKDVELTKGSADFTLELNSGTAKENEDFYSVKNAVTIRNGSSCSDPVKVVLPDDFKSEGDETFTAEATFVGGEYANYTSNSFGQSQESTLTINDHINGPRISLTGTGSTGENGTATYTVTLDKALEEPADLTFRLDIGSGDSKANFVLGEIASITVDGVVYTISEDGTTIAWKTSETSGNYAITDGTQKVHLGSDGYLYVTMTMENGLVREGFSVTMRNDYITENTETLPVVLVGTKGGELLGKNGEIISESNTQHVDTKITDVPDGPTISLSKYMPTEDEAKTHGMEGQSVSVTIGLSKATVSETTITLQLGKDVAAEVVKGNTVELSNGNGYQGEGTIDPATGKVTFTLPKGVTGPLTVTFPLQDNVETGLNDTKFSVSLDASGISGTNGGETSLAGSLSFSSTFEGETNNSMTFTMGAGGSVSADAKGLLTLSGIAGGAACIDKIELTYPGGNTVTITGAQLTTNGSNLNYTWNAPAGSSLAGVVVNVLFNPDALATMDAKDLAATKLNAGVSGSLSGMSVTVDVLDDAKAPQADGPVFSVEAGEPTNEGSNAQFTVRIDKGDLPEGKLTQDVTLTFTLAGGVGTPTCSLGPITSSSGKYTLTIPKGTSLADVTITVPTTQDTVVDSNRTVALTLTGVDGQEARLAEDGAEHTGSVPVYDTTVATTFTLAASAQEVTEGGNAAFTMSWNKATYAKCADKVDFTFKVNAPEGVEVSIQVGSKNITSTVGAEGKLVFTLEAADLKNNASLKLSVPVEDDGTVGSVANDKVTVSLENVQLQDEPLRDVPNRSADIPVADSGIKALTARFENTTREGAQNVAVLIGASNMAALAAYVDSEGLLTQNIALTLALKDKTGNSITREVTLEAGEYNLNSPSPITLENVFLGHDAGSTGFYDSLSVAVAAIAGITVPSPVYAEQPIVQQPDLDFEQSLDGVHYAVAEGNAIDHLIIGSTHEDTLSGGAGQDTILGGIGSDLLNGGDGDDLLVGGNLHYDGYDGKGALEHLVADAGSSNVHDIASYLQENTHLLGQGTAQDGNNTLHGGAGNDLLISGGGHDTIFGHEGDDILFGGAGNDVLYGGPGNDTMYGGAGADTFAWGEGDLTGESHDVIMDFDYSEDKLRFDDIFNEENSLQHMLESIEITEISENKLVLKVLSDDSLDKGDVIELNMGADEEYRQIYNQYSSAAADETQKNQLQEELLKHIIANSN